MPPLVTDLTRSDVVAALEANDHAFYAAFGRVSDALLCDEGDVVWFATPWPVALFNGVMRARFPDAAVATRIAATLAPFQQRQLPMLWHLGPSTRPTDLGTHLHAVGLRDLGDGAGMAMSLDAVPAPASRPAGLQIVRVADAATLLDWVRVFTNDDADGIAHCHMMYARLGLGPDVPLRHFLGLLHGEPVATASSFAAAGVISVQHVTTRPAVQRRGIGTAMTHAVLVDGQQQGYRVAVLESSPEGHMVYHRLGFQDVCTCGLFMWAGEPG